MNAQRPNVLIYAGIGATVESVRHAAWSLRRLLSPHYAVVTVDGDALVKEPWPASCALLVFPGGADLGYCQALNGEGNRRIVRYVNGGGAYLGLCAGGYYGSKRCEFEVGDDKMEVVGDRELAFFPGICRGLAFPGFVYNSEAGARAVELKVNRDTLGESVDNLPDSLKVYYNGGGAFVDADSFLNRGVEVLASFTEKLKVDSGRAKAAVVYRKVGDGHIILSGPHPEFAAVNLRKHDGSSTPAYDKVVETIAKHDGRRTLFLKACLLRLGLRINEHEQAVPSLSRLHLSSSRVEDVSGLLSSWQDIVTLEDGEEYIHAENDTFHLEKPSRWSTGALKEALNAVASTLTGPHSDSAADDDSDDRIILDYNKIVKRLVAHESKFPNSKETPCFNHHSYYSHLQYYQAKADGIDGDFGKLLLYGEVVTSTNTLLEKNPKLLNRLPSGLTATATTQVAGRGRGANVWVAPPGSLIYSVVMRHPLQLTQSAPVVFIQYIAGLAAIKGVQNYQLGYDRLDVKLKWPNDIYAADPASGHTKAYVKVGGILVNSSYAGQDYTLVAGVGINVANGSPTTTLDALATNQKLPCFQMEKLLASILTKFEELYTRFKAEGWSRYFEDMYYANWLHNDQTVTLETEGGAVARIKGITSDWGLLLAEELGQDGRTTGKTWALQSDSNSFDFFKGLLKRKV